MSDVDGKVLGILAAAAEDIRAWRKYGDRADRWHAHGLYLAAVVFGAQVPEFDVWVESVSRAA